MDTQRVLREPDATRGWLATIAVHVTRKRLHRRRLYAWIGFAGAGDHEQALQFVVCTALLSRSRHGTV